MRVWHRRLSIFVAAFMFFIAVTGAVLQAEMMLDSGRQPVAAPPGASATAASTINDKDAHALFASSLAGARRLTQGQILGIDLRFIGAAPVAIVVVSDPKARRIQLDARSGQPLDATNADGGGNLHGLLLDLHRGAFAGTVGLWISLVCGLVLAVLSATGLAMYVQVLRRRLANGQKGWLW